jgi:imidazoleglycerol-phosphate dehydratase
MRKAKVVRKTTETDISLEIAIGCRRPSSIDTTIPFLDHMLTLVARHGAFRLTIKAKGDTNIDDHHLVEDVGICLGLALAEALGDKKGIARYGWALIPMDETLCKVALDVSGRPYLTFNVKLANRRKLGTFDPSLVKEFFKAFTDKAGLALHINLEYGANTHHIVEGIFKAFALALKMAVATDGAKDAPSTKGQID